MSGLAEQPTAADVRAWRKLIKAARAQTAENSPVELSDARRRAFRALTPIGHRGRDSAFNLLCLEARICVEAATAEAKAASIIQLQALADRAEGVLDATHPESAG